MLRAGLIAFLFVFSASDVFAARAKNVTYAYNDVPFHFQKTARKKCANEPSKIQYLGPAGPNLNEMVYVNCAKRGSSPRPPVKETPKRYPASVGLFYLTDYKRKSDGANKYLSITAECIDSVRFGEWFRSFEASTSKIRNSLTIQNSALLISLIDVSYQSRQLGFQPQANTKSYSLLGELVVSHTAGEPSDTDIASYQSLVKNLSLVGGNSASDVKESEDAARSFLRPKHICPSDGKTTFLNGFSTNRQYDHELYFDTIYVLANERGNIFKFIREGLNIFKDFMTADGTTVAVSKAARNLLRLTQWENVEELVRKQFNNYYRGNSGTISLSRNGKVLGKILITDENGDPLFSINFNWDKSLLQKELWTNSNPADVLAEFNTISKAKDTSIESGVTVSVDTIRDGEIAVLAPECEAFREAISNKATLSKVDPITRAVIGRAILRYLVGQSIDLNREIYCLGPVFSDTLKAEGVIDTDYTVALAALQPEAPRSMKELYASIDLPPASKLEEMLRQHGITISETDRENHFASFAESETTREVERACSDLRDYLSGLLYTNKLLDEGSENLSYLVLAASEYRNRTLQLVGKGHDWRVTACLSKGLLPKVKNHWSQEYTAVLEVRAAEEQAQTPIYKFKKYVLPRMERMAKAFKNSIPIYKKNRNSIVVASHYGEYISDDAIVEIYIDGMEVEAGDEASEGKGAAGGNLKLIEYKKLLRWGGDTTLVKDTFLGCFTLPLAKQNYASGEFFGRIVRKITDGAGQEIVQMKYLLFATSDSSEKIAISRLLHPYVDHRDYCEAILTRRSAEAAKCGCNSGS